MTFIVILQKKLKFEYVFYLVSNLKFQPFLANFRRFSPIMSPVSTSLFLTGNGGTIPFHFPTTAERSLDSSRQRRYVSLPVPDNGGTRPLAICRQRRYGPSPVPGYIRSIAPEVMKTSFLVWGEQGPSLFVTRKHLHQLFDII